MCWMACSPLQGQSAWEFPSLQEVINSFYSQYRFDESEDKRLYFARKPDGWYLYETPLQERQRVVKEEIFWSIRTNSYLPIHYSRLPMSAQADVRYHYQRYLSYAPWSEYGYERCAWYGYPGWEEDMIAAFGGLASLAPRELEGLARAYDHLADQLAFATGGIYHADHQPLGYDSLADGPRLETWTRFIDSALAYDRRLVAIAPDYVLRTGNPAISTAHRLVSAARQLEGMKRPELAEDYWQQAHYDSLITTVAQMQLAACPPGAVLLAQGDNDYFPLILVQKMRGIQTNVTVLNANWLQMTWYREMMTEALGLTFSSAELDQLRAGYMTVAPDLDTLRVPLPQSRHIWRLPTQRSGYSRYLEADKIFLIKWLQAQAKSPAPRPLFVSYFSDPRLYPGLYEFLQLEGLVYRLVGTRAAAFPEDPLNYLYGRANEAALTDFLQELLSEDLSWWQDIAWESSAHRTITSALIRVAYHGAFPLATASQDSMLTLDERQRHQETVLLLLDKMKPLFSPLRRQQGNAISQLAILGYLVGAEAEAGQWERRLYDVLDLCVTSPANSEAASTAIQSLQLLGYYFQESGRNVQRIALERELDTYEKALGMIDP